jgi:hypothetical protein
MVELCHGLNRSSKMMSIDITIQPGGIVVVARAIVFFRPPVRVYDFQHPSSSHHQTTGMIVIPGTGLGGAAGGVGLTPKERVGPK